ncbi:putative 3-demethylubiquinone-9 3-methyltransferase (glyoxalase superfamily) [Amycolatopsis bartoniae]|uniref:VOC family protein n=1 Tax=Amycolatopsis bartoniae TaxID=941986 RepID=A0A8H9IZN4_9PSEU|nr:VOC family protein [Amycolatopsis bartoniae]MBB2935862.1 putative 3-demethylubiquinone-9 3-methyltransferase (glyoxalase superfamily) [Amycolatopsis bartoniae]TVT04997.1 VOC family protein [Amycolatopsis bartoniae]GHF62389.1 VOC family protein [Amycolatopsis bartoniae]
MTDNRLTTCLWFDGRAEDAANFYVTVFDNASIGQVARYPGTGGGPAGSVMTVEFEINGQKFVGLNGGPQFKFTEAVSFQIPCETQEEVDYYWDRLTADGGEEGPCGWVKDKFGLSWQVVPNRLLELTTGPDAEQAARAFEAMMSMHKLDIAALEKAAAG